MNMEPENHLFEQGNHLNQTSIFGFQHVNFPGYSLLISQILRICTIAAQPIVLWKATGWRQAPTPQQKAGGMFVAHVIYQKKMEGIYAQGYVLQMWYTDIHKF